MILTIINSQLKLDEMVAREYIVKHFPLHNKTYFFQGNNLEL